MVLIEDTWFFNSQFLLSRRVKIISVGTKIAGCHLQLILLFVWQTQQIQRIAGDLPFYKVVVFAIQRYFTVVAFICIGRIQIRKIESNFDFYQLRIFILIMINYAGYLLGGLLAKVMEQVCVTEKVEEMNNKKS